MAEQRQQQTEVDAQLKDSTSDEGKSGDNSATSLDEKDPAGSWYPQAGEEANKADDAK